MIQPLRRNVISVMKNIDCIIFICLIMFPDNLIKCLHQSIIFQATGTHPHQKLPHTVRISLIIRKLIFLQIFICFRKRHFLRKRQIFLLLNVPSINPSISIYPPAIRVIDVRFTVIRLVSASISSRLIIIFSLRLSVYPYKSLHISRQLSVRLKHLPPVYIRDSSVLSALSILEALTVPRRYFFLPLFPPPA